ncbi:MAG: GTPase ObgE [Candidatus Taylorbacteria bacterium]|nr:GTPase ObgE [Candidatus Taylorbacteria bacterium]
MAFVDELTIHLKAGRGGNGVIRWLHEKFREYGGPSGGDGGKGGDIYIKAVRNTALLAKYRHEKVFEAEKGSDGESKSKTGAGGDDFVLDLPIGSLVTNLDNRRRYELLEEGQTFKILEGGFGGKGNRHFKSFTDTKPHKATPGKQGDEADFYIELQLIADAGFIGLPNAGKTSLLNELTSSAARVADYPFTTLEPNLGDFFGFILADVPGLIEGAAEGKGLGDKFLRHIRRTKLLIHCISLENKDVKKTYKVVRDELVAYDKALLEKKEIVVLTKTDISDPKKIAKAEKALEKTKAKIFKVSILDDKSIKKLSDSLAKMLKKKLT